MARKRKGRGPSEGEFGDFVPAVFARSATEADEYRELLNDHDIPAIVEVGEEDLPPRAARAPGPPRKSISRGVPILVPEALLDEASEILADRDYDDYRPGGDDDDADEDEELEFTPEPAPRPLAPEEDEEKPARKPSAADDPFEEDDEAFVIEDEEDEDPDDLEEDGKERKGLEDEEEEEEEEEEK